VNLKKSELTPGVGFGRLKFGMSTKDVESLLGAPEHMENPDEDGDIIYIYDKIGINFLSFDKENDFRLTTIELNRNSRAFLWDVNIFDQPFIQIEQLVAANGYSLTFVDSYIDEDNDENSEILYKIDPLRLTFYFDKSKKLREICIGVAFNKNDEIEWPP
jgi:hypothetical protein